MDASLLHVQGGCKHRHRWKASEGADPPADDELGVQFPVDLAWSGLACKVRLIMQLHYNLLPAHNIGQGDLRVCMLTHSG